MLPGETTYFNATSKLLPNEASEPYASALLKWMGIAMSISRDEHSSFDSEPTVFEMKDCYFLT